jgi:hypothetical protein
MMFVRTSRGRLRRRWQRKRWHKKYARELNPWARLGERYVYRWMALRPHAIYPARLPPDFQLDDRQHTLLNASIKFGLE